MIDYTGHIGCKSLICPVFYDFSEGILLYSRYLNISDGNIPPPPINQ
jgi:hypothetical protein